MREYNLIRERFLPCLMLDGTKQYLSLEQVFAMADKIREIEGDSPVSTISLYRLLLAIIYRVEEVGNITEWQSIWDKKNFDISKYKNYFDKWSDGFNLLSDKTPFYQTLGGMKSDAPVNSLYEDRDSGNNPIFFSHDYDDNGKDIDFREATIRIISHQNFAFMGGASTTWTIGDKEYSTGARKDAPLNRYLTFLLQGDNLFQTLMLNLVFQSKSEKDRDSVPWEDYTVDLGKLPNIPRGIADLYTWQSRRISFVVDEDNLVRRICLAQGREYDSTGIEDPMKFYHQDKKKGWMAFKKRAGRAVWRDIEPLLAAVKWDSVKTNKPPMIIEQVALLASEDIGVSYAQILKIDVFGLLTEPGKPKIYSWHHERYNIPLVYLKDITLFGKMKDAMELLDKFEGILSRSLWQYSGIVLRSGDKNSIKAMVNRFPLIDVYWNTMENRFLELLDGLQKKEDIDKYFEDWVRCVVNDIQSIYDSVFDDNQMGDIGSFKATIIVKKKIMGEINLYLKDIGINLKGEEKE